MLSEAFREWLYPLGFCSSLAFGGRILWQWLASELKGESIVPKAFWVLTIIGNVLAFVHSFIQVQYHVCVIASFNGVIAWRNLNLMKPDDQQFKFGSTLLIIVSFISITTALFALQESHTWFRIPVQKLFEGAPKEVSLFWHLLGFLGIILFSSRFWMQWLLSEYYKKSLLSPAFWWVSLIGGYLSASYFLYIHDVVNAIGPLIGTVPYFRNLILIYRNG